MPPGASWSGRGGGGLTPGHGLRRRAVRRGLDAAAGTAAVDDLEAVVAVLERGSRDQQVGGVKVEREERGLRARVVAVGVVVATGLAQVGECRDDVRRVLAEVVELGL